MKCSRIPAVALFLVAVAVRPSWVQATAPPNIVWIIAEDMGADLGCWGTDVHTPNIDQLAKEGMRFTRVFGTASVCMPNRTAMITGITQSTLGSVTMRPPKEYMRPLPENVLPLPALMRELGYFTANVRQGAWGCNGKDDWNFRFDGPDWDSRRLRDLSVNQPFYAQFNFVMSHRPFRQDDERPIDPADVKLPPYYPDHPVTRQSWSDYLESIQHLDRGVGEVLAWLEREEMADNTIIFFISDNGPPFLRCKYFLYDDSLNQPLIIRWPKDCQPPPDFRPGTASDRLMSAIDITAQTVVCGGGKPPEWMHGRAFFGTNAAPRREVFSAADWYGDAKLKSRTIRTETHRYIRNFKTDTSVHGASSIYRQAKHPMYHLIPQLAAKNQLSALHQRILLDPLPAEELYDLQADPDELTNLIDHIEYADLKRELTTRLDDWITSSGDLGFEPLDPGHVKYFDDYRQENRRRYRAEIDRMRQLVAEQVNEHVSN